MQSQIEQLLAVYNAAVYAVDDSDFAFKFRIGEPSFELNDLLKGFNASRAAFITAENPGSKPLPQIENTVRQNRLIEFVKNADYQFLRGYGADAGDVWKPENSILIIGIERAAALELARGFGQNAFVYCEKGSPPVLVCCL